MDARLHSPSVARNRDPILAALRPALPRTGLLLEVASGSGEHAAYLAAALPPLQFQPTAPSPRRWPASTPGAPACPTPALP